MYYHQRTIARSVTCSGVGVHSGREVNMTLKPAPTNHGIKFIRTDIPDKPIVSAHFNSVVDTSLATVIGSDGIIVSTIEHLMACFAGFSIDNAIVELDSYEVPIMDGSAWPFAELIRSAGIREQVTPRYFFIIRNPIELNEKDRSVGIYPSDSYKITCTIDFKHPIVKKQSYTIDVSDQIFEKEISKARTFGFIQETEYLRRYGFARGASLDNAVVIDKETIMNDGGLRYKNEFVRHKILDCIGDFSLLGMPILGHVVLNKSGHAFNHAFIKKVFIQKDAWETGTYQAVRSDQPIISAKSV